MYNIITITLHPYPPQGFGIPFKQFKNFRDTKTLGSREYIIINFSKMFFYFYILAEI